MSQPKLERPDKGKSLKENTEPLNLSSEIAQERQTKIKQTNEPNLNILRVKDMNSTQNRSILRSNKGL
jgi:hypothetical protein